MTLRGKSLSESKPLTQFQEFIESVKAKIPINELYTKLTGFEFVYIDSRPRALISWREDKTPSLSLYTKENKLNSISQKTDFIKEIQK